MPVPKWSIRIVGMDVIPSAVRNKSDIFQFVRFGAAQSDTVSKRGHEKSLKLLIRKFSYAFVPDSANIFRNPTQM